MKQLFLPCQWKRTSRVKLISLEDCVFTCHCRWPWHAASNYPQSTLYKNTQEFRLNTRAYLVSFLFFLYLFRTITEMWYKQSNVKTKRNMRMHPESYFLNTYWIYQWQLQWFYKTVIQTVIQTKNKYRKIMIVTKITLRRKKLLKKMLIFAQFLQMLNIDFSEWMIRIC